jgi:tRNA A37 threonylcarbamoyladenosine dehydratase
MRKDMRSGLSLTRSPDTVNLVTAKRKLNLRGEELAADLVREQLSRNYSFFGEDAMASIQSAFVIVVGCGGVGSHAAHMLVRSGITRIRIIGK